MNDFETVRDGLVDGYPGALAALDRIEAKVERLQQRIIEAETRPALSRRIKELDAEVERLRAKVVKAQAVALAWGDGDNDKMQVALLDLFLNLYGQAPRRNALAEEKE
jgi:hypothetical protein